MGLIEWFVTGIRGGIIGHRLDEMVAFAVQRIGFLVAF